MPSFDKAREPLPDADIMRRVQWGNEPAFAALYHRYYRNLLDFFYALCRDPHEAEDLCHETFLRIWKLRARYTESGKFTAYLFSVARHIWMERRRQARKEWRLGVMRETGTEEAENAACARLAPDQQAARAELDARVFSILEQLPEEQRMAFVLRTIEGLSLEDIAAIMNCPINTVRSRRLLAIKRLREALRGLLVL